jgi:4'-phosphopantetheinyl transferase
VISEAPVKWVRPYEFPALADGALHVWRANLESLADEIAMCLCEEELARAGFLRDTNRQIWMRARGVLRVLLGRYLERDPRSLRFDTSKHGKPFLLPPSGGASKGDRAKAEHGKPRELRFNLSHSGSVALIAISATSEVGVDVELARDRIDVVALAAHVFGPAEGRRLGALVPSLARREFLRRWVAHEADLKCNGVGLLAPPSPGSRVAWRRILDIGQPEGIAAVATTTRPSEVRCCLVEAPTAGEVVARAAREAKTPEPASGLLAFRAVRPMCPNSP